MTTFTVVIDDRGHQHYLDGIPISDKEAVIARRKFGEPEHDEVE